MKRRLGIGALLLLAVGLLGLGLVGVAAAQGGPGPRGGQRDGQGGPGGGQRGAIVQAVADLLGMTPDQVVAERRAGKSLAAIAAERGVDQTTLVQAITVTARARLDEQVAAGRLTAERADALYQRLQQAAPQIVTSTESPRFGRGGSERNRGPDGSGRGTDGGGRGPGGPGPSDSAPTP